MRLRSDLRPATVLVLFAIFAMSVVVVFSSNAQLEFNRDLRRYETGDRSRLSPSIESERAQFRALLLQNPNYFGNIEGSELAPVKVMSNNTSYEELKCIGYNPPLKRLEAVVHVKKAYGYGGGVCSNGTSEYVRFYVDWNNDGNWVEVGMASFTAYNIPGDKPLEYAVTLQLDPKEKFCTTENLPNVRAILSWNVPPPPNDPHSPPVWGNVVEARIQIDAADFLMVQDLFEVAKVKLPDEVLAKIDLTQSVPVLEPKELSLGELKTLYQGTNVPPHRFGFSHVQKLMAKPILTEIMAEPKMTKSAPVGALAELDINIAELIDAILKTDGDTRYEALTCIGLNPNQDALVGVLKSKLPSGYSGNLCTKGSYEYVAFWEKDEIEQTWLYLGTSAVNVHDIKNMPSEGLEYSVFLPIDASRHRRPCTNGPTLVKIRAIMSWQTPPPPTNPNWIPYWGNRLETTVHIKPGPDVIGSMPYIESVGNMAVCDINQSTGLATGTGIIAAFTADESPFGGTVTITGFITNPPNSMEDPSSAMKYKVFVRPHAPTESDIENPWQPLANKFWITVSEQTGTSLPIQKPIKQKIDLDGYYTYLEDPHQPDWRHVAGRVLAKWITNAPMTGMWEIRIEAKTSGGAVIPGGTMMCADGSTRSIVRLRLDNEQPSPVEVAITGYQRGSDPTVHPGEGCGKFVRNDVIHGTYSVADKHFGRLTLTVHPAGPAHGATVNPSSRSYSIVPTTGESGTWTLNTSGMDPCGYIVRLWARDRTIVNSGSIGWRNSDDVGFCIEP